ncbi:MAG: hypothetical protein WDM94_14990 [Bauldia sp.]
MPETWETYYLMVGSSAGALIGLLFVVITLSGEAETARVTAVQRTFLSPTVFHFVTVLVISCAAVVTTLPAPAMALTIAVPTVVGIMSAVAAFYRLASGKLTATHWSDYVFYGVLPAIGHVWLFVTAWMVWQQTAFAEYGVALGAMALLLLGIRDAWDLATWLVYNKKG